MAQASPIYKKEIAVHRQRLISYSEFLQLVNKNTLKGHLFTSQKGNHKKRGGL